MLASMELLNEKSSSSHWIWTALPNKILKMAFRFSEKSNSNENVKHSNLGIGFLIGNMVKTLILFSAKYGLVWCLLAPRDVSYLNSHWVVAMPTRLSDIFIWIHSGK